MEGGILKAKFTLPYGPRRTLEYEGVLPIDSSQRGRSKCTSYEGTEKPRTGAEPCSGYEKQYSQTGRIKMSRYLIITGFSAYSPDLPGCVATAITREVEREMHDAIEFHLEGLRHEGEPISPPRSEAAYCEVG
jgi:predicted RNase H-like HicB family nuclease